MMVNNLPLNNTWSTDDKDDEIILNRERTSYGSTSFSPAIVNVVAEAGENFFRYLKNIGLSKDPDLIVLSSKHHYYCEGNELKSVRTLINLKKLNLIKHLDMFLFTLIRILPQNANFIGCFSDNKALKRNAFHFYQPSSLLNRIINFLDSSTDHNMDKNEVSEILERNGFKIVDMTEMNGLTYFYSQKISERIELIA
jgi:hypothetical protein